MGPAMEDLETTVACPFPSVIALFLLSSSAWAQAQPPIRMNFEGLSRRCEALSDSGACKRAVARMENAYNKVVQATDNDVLKSAAASQDAENDFKKRYPDLWETRFE